MRAVWAGALSAFECPSMEGKRAWIDCPMAPGARGYASGPAGLVCVCEGVVRLLSGTSHHQHHHHQPAMDVMERSWEECVVEVFDPAVSEAVRGLMPPFPFQQRPQHVRGPSPTPPPFTMGGRGRVMAAWVWMVVGRTLAQGDLVLQRPRPPLSPTGKRPDLSQRVCV